MLQLRTLELAQGNHECVGVGGEGGMSEGVCQHRGGSFQKSAENRSMRSRGGFRCKVYLPSLDGVLNQQRENQYEVRGVFSKGYSLSCGVSWSLTVDI